MYIREEFYVNLRIIVSYSVSDTLSFFFLFLFLRGSKLDVSRTRAKKVKSAVQDIMYISLEKLEL